MPGEGGFPASEIFLSGSGKEGSRPCSQDETVQPVFIRFSSAAGRVSQARAYLSWTASRAFSMASAGAGLRFQAIRSLDRDQTHHLVGSKW